MRYLLAVTLLLFASAAHAEKGEIESFLYDYLYEDERGYLAGYAMGLAKGIAHESDMWINRESACIPEGAGPREIIKTAHEYARDQRLSSDPEDNEWIKSVDYLGAAYDLMKIAAFAKWGFVTNGDCHLYDQYQEQANR